MTLKIKWFAHAAFLLEGDGVRVITDPYLPEATGFSSIDEPADVVIRSSADDDGHCHAAMIRGNPVVVTATELPAEGVTIGALTVTGIAAQESLVHKSAPRDNAMYRFTLAGLRVAHLGDVGNRLTDDQLAGLRDVDVMFVPAGGPPTIELDDLCAALRVVKPAVIVPMHYHLPGLKANLLPVTEFTRRYPSAMVTWIDGSEFDAASVGDKPQIVVLQASTLNQDETRP